MKKFLIAGSMMLLLVGVQCNHNLYGSHGLFDDTSLESSLEDLTIGGDANQLIVAAGKKVDDYTANPVGMVGFRFSSLNDYNPFGEKITDAQIEKQNKETAKHILRYYKNNIQDESGDRSQINYIKASQVLHADIRALDQKIDSNSNATLKNELRKILDEANMASKSLHKAMFDKEIGRAHV